MKNWKVILLVAIAALTGVSAYLTFGLKSEEEVKDTVVVTNVKRSAEAVRKKKNKKNRWGKNREVKVAGLNAKKEKPTFVLDDDDEANLNEEQRKTITAIREALAGNDKTRVLKLVQELQASDEWPDGIPKSIKMAAIEALGWFGVACLPEIAGFLADGDPEVVQSATDKYEEALSDPELSDRERAKILIEAGKIIDDPEAMDSMLFSLIEMRHSVAVATMKALMAEGNDATQQVLPDNIEFITGEESMDSPEKLDKWLAENPDDEDDEEFYGNGKGDNSNK